MKFTEAHLEAAIIDLHGEVGYPHVLGEAIERQPQEVLIKADLRAAGFNEHLSRHNVRGLRKLVERLRWSPAGSTWSDYTETHGYDTEAQQHKTTFVEHALSSRRWRMVWDLGCNTGTYTRLACQHADYVVAMDADHLVIDRFYRSLADTATRSQVLPLVCDLADPSPGIGWRGKERQPPAQS